MSLGVIADSELFSQNSEALGATSEAFPVIHERKAVNHN